MVGLLLLVSVVLVGIAGITVASIWARILLWLLSIPPACLAFFIVSLGGLVEPMSTKGIVEACAFLFWPAAGCAIGEIRLYSYRKLVRQTVRGFPVITGTTAGPSKSKR